ncbi:putative beta-amylase [Helianthus anomalus]
MCTREVGAASDVSDPETQVALAGENVLPRYDDYAHDQILKATSLSDNEEMCAFTYLRMNPELFQDENEEMCAFVKKMKMITIMICFLF